MKNKLVKILLLVIIAITLVGCTNNKKSDAKKTEAEKTIKVMVYNKEEKEIYNDKIKSNKKKLVDVLKQAKDLELKTETGDYGEYVVSIKGISQEDDYYWNYYVNDKYSDVGIKNNDEIKFKLEKFEGE